MTQPKVILLSSTEYPLETMAYAWHVMQRNVPDSLEEFHVEHDNFCLSRSDPAWNPLEENFFKEQFREIVKDGVGTPAEFVSTNWVFKNVSRAFQQQLTRYRLASFSAQTLRRVDVGAFASKKLYHMPPGMEGPEQRSFHREMLHIQEKYGNLIKRGVSIEDARGILPLNTYSTITMSCNLRSLANIVKQRLCTHAQAEWAEVVKQMEAEVRSKMPGIIAKELFQPTCMKIGKCFVPDRCCGRVNGNEPKI